MTCRLSGVNAWDNGRGGGDDVSSFSNLLLDDAVFGQFVLDLLNDRPTLLTPGTFSAHYNITRNLREGLLDCDCDCDKNDTSKTRSQAEGHLYRLGETQSRLSIDNIVQL